MVWESYKEPTPPCVVILLPPTWQEVICLAHIYSLSMSATHCNSVNNLPFSFPSWNTRPGIEFHFDNFLPGLPSHWTILWTCLPWALGYSLKKTTTNKQLFLQNALLQKCFTMLIYYVFSDLHINQNVRLYALKM